MKKNTERFVYGFRSSSSRIGLLALSAIVAVGLISQVQAYSTITSQLDFGETNTDVTHLQTFFADNSQVYPSGLITGYFGTLTRAAVIRFQSLYGIDQAGRVGPVTRDKINSIILGGGWTGVTPSPSSNLSGPTFYSLTKSQSNTSASFNFTTDEMTTVRVVYHTSPLMFKEGDINSVGFGPIGGSEATDGSILSTSHSLTMANLQPNTLYYYTIIATDQQGNASVYGPNNALRTNN